MPYQNISAALTPEDLQAINAAVEAIEAMLPFLVSLTPEERQQMHKMCNSQLAFMNKCLNAARKSGYFPAVFNMGSLSRIISWRRC